MAARARGVVKTRPTLSSSTRHELDQTCIDVIGSSFEELVTRCRRADEDARASGGLHGWRPTGPSTLPIRIALAMEGC